MGGIGSVPCEGFLIGGNSACRAMSSSEFLGIYAFSMALGSLSTKVQHCLPVSLKDWSGAIGH